MLFLGASKDKEIFFESVRKDDGKYIFGKIILDSRTKDVEIEFETNTKAEVLRQELLKTDKGKLSQTGTRIFIPNPRIELTRSFLNHELEEFIQSTWWEILQKNHANIEIASDSNKIRVAPSPWLPTDNVKSSQTYKSGLVEVDKTEDLRIKNVSLIFLGEKEIPEIYKGISIQRKGMSIQRLSAAELAGDKIGDKIYGSIELDKGFEEALTSEEAPEHCNIFWQRTYARKLKQELRQQVHIFIKKYKLADTDNEFIRKSHREAVSEAEKILNELAKDLKLIGIGATSIRMRNVEERLPNEKLRLSIADFKTPV